MELNETLQKVDHTLDSTVKKVEKQAKDMLAKELRIEVTKAQHGKYLPHPFMNSHPLAVDVADYIKNFSWDDNKFNRGRSLVEIAGLITDVIKDRV